MEDIMGIIENSSERMHLIKEFQTLVWNDKNAKEIFINLDFYQPDINKRENETIFYGDEQLIRYIKLALQTDSSLFA